MYQIGDVLRGGMTGDLYAVSGKSKNGGFDLTKIWINPDHYRARNQSEGSVMRYYPSELRRMTLVGRNYQEKAK